MTAPALPPRARSRAARALDRFAALGELRLQRCRGCGRALWPPRDACPACLAPDLVWDAVAAGGRLLAATEVRASAEPWFAARLPWRMGSVAADAGPVVIAHLAPGLARGDRVRLGLRLDRTGRAALVAGPEGEEWTVPEFSDDPAGRRVRLEGCPPALEAALAAALSAAGAALAAPGAPAEIVVAGLGPPRPGPLLGACDADALGADIAAFLAALCAGLPAAGAGGVWVGLIGIGAFAPSPAAAAEGIRAAAALAAARALRAETRARGLRVATVFHGPLAGPETPGGLAPAAVAHGVLDLLRRGGEEAWVGPEAAAARASLEADPLGHPWVALAEAEA